jgi:pyroglutamyl-peptidase
MLRVLITGFEPFGGESINPSYEAIKHINVHTLACELFTMELPVVFYDASKLIIQKIHEIEPDVIIMVGQAGGRKEVSVERVAINLDDSHIPDHHGVAPQDDPISVFGPSAYFSTLPTKMILKALQDDHIPAKLSYSAGTYLCNHIFYSVMHELDVNPNKNIRAGFIHVPFETSQTLYKAHQFSLDLSVITRALEVIIETCIQSSSV